MSTTNGNTGFAARVLIAGAVVLLLVAAAMLVWTAVDVLLIVFAGILLAIFLRSLASFVCEHTPLSAGWALAVVILGLAGLVALPCWLLTPEISRQAGQLSEELPKSVERLQTHLEGTAWGDWVLEKTDNPGEYLPGRKRLLQEAGGILSTAVGALASLVVFVAVGLYLAAEPATYRKGVLLLIPLRRRKRAAEVVASVGSVLQWWILGKLLGMAIIGVLTWLGLWALGIPLALTLAIIAALLTFIPNIGPVLALVPAVLLALAESPAKALWVTGLYLGIQAVESYLITPLVQRRTISMPPALTITAQLLMGVLVGALGVVLATPLTAAAMVLVKELYVEREPGEEGSEATPAKPG